MTRAMSLTLSSGDQRSPPPRSISRCMRALVSLSETIACLSFSVGDSLFGVVLSGFLTLALYARQIVVRVIELQLLIGGDGC